MKRDNLFPNIVEFIKGLYPGDFIPLHVPRFNHEEGECVGKCVESTMVSYVGEYVNKFESQVAEYVGCKHAIATVNGTSALQVALRLAGVGENCEVLTPSVTFVATVNPIAYLHAHPVFIDSDRDTFGLDPEKLEEFLKNNSYIDDDGACINKTTQKRIAACVVTHIFGHPAKINSIKKICDDYRVKLVEDAAESLGSTYDGRHTGTYGMLGILSFNGNKIITTGGGGMIITDDDELARRAKHITTTAKAPHKWEYIHDELGYNYRLPSVNAALGVAQMNKLGSYLENKRELASIYKKYFDSTGVEFFREKEPSFSNYWLNAIIFDNRDERDAFLNYSNDNGVMTRPLWNLISDLDMYKHCQSTDLSNAKWLQERVVNIPSSVRL
jgi:perosamine synthetase